MELEERAPDDGPYSRTLWKLSVRVSGLRW